MMANPTLLLATFDETLALTDTSGAATFTGVDPVRYDDLGAAHGIWVEEAGSNEHINPYAGTNTTGLSLWFGRGTLARTTDVVVAPGVSTAFRITRGASNTTLPHGIFTAPSDCMEAVQNDLVAISVWAYQESGEARDFRFRINELQGTTTVKTTDSTIASVLSGMPTRVTAIYTMAEASADHVQAIFAQWNAASATNGEHFWLSALQMEPNAYVTSAIPALDGNGTIVAGYAWTGTAHASTSTRAASSASVDPTARIDASAGAIAFRYKRLIDTGGEEIILTCGNAGAGEDYLEIGVDASDDLYMEWDSNGGGANRVTIATTIATDTEYLFYFDWDGTTIRASINNGSLSSDTRDAVEDDLTGGNLTLSAATGSHVIGPFAVFDRQLVAQEITNIYEMQTWRFDMLTGTSPHILMPRMNVRNNTLLRR